MSVEKAVQEFVRDQRIAEIRHVVSEVEFVPKGFTTPVRVKVYRHTAVEEMPYYFKTSHFAQTPMQTSPHIIDDPWAESPAAAAKMAVEGLLACLEEAISIGHKPRNEWLVENVFWM